MASALGVLNWSPDVFWKATVYEYTVAMKGYMAVNGITTTPQMTRNDFLDLKAQISANEKRHA